MWSDKWPAGHIWEYPPFYCHPGHDEYRPRSGSLVHRRTANFRNVKDISVSQKSETVLKTRNRPTVGGHDSRTSGDTHHAQGGNKTGESPFTDKRRAQQAA